MFRSILPRSLIQKAEFCAKCCSQTMYERELSRFWSGSPFNTEHASSRDVLRGSENATNTLLIVDPGETLLEREIYKVWVLGGAEYPFFLWSSPAYGFK